MNKPRPLLNVMTGSWRGNESSEETVNYHQKKPNCRTAPGQEQLRIEIEFNTQNIPRKNTEHCSCLLK